MKKVLSRIAAVFIPGLLILPVACVDSKTPESQKEIASLYTSLETKDCQTLQVDEEIGNATLSCPGTAGYGLYLLDDNMRQSITIITPNRHEFPLNYWHVITPYFSYLGKKAEWRVTLTNGTSKPIALIIQVNAQVQKDVDAKPETKSYLAVAKITQKEICVTDRIPLTATAIEKARTAAETATKKTCLEQLPQ